MHDLNLSLFGDGGAADSADNTADNNNADTADNLSKEEERDQSGGDPVDTAENKNDNSAEKDADSGRREEYERLLELSARRERLLRMRLFELGEARRSDAAINEYRSRLREAEELKKEFPGFDIRAEVKDRRFRAMLESGIDLRSAYTALHSRDVVDAALEDSRKRMTSEIIRRSTRPSENGTSDQSAAVGTPDISSLTRPEIEAIERRVARGEKIYLK